MKTEALAKAAYWGGWAAAVVAVFYKFLISFGVCEPLMQVFPRHLWQTAFLLFIASIASEGLGRAKA
ncbi:MAG TPA: hypothetical protein VNN18_06295 [Candidatus Xenobia bacterium]|nr:hypothetical protein [Candidatus Xenobia bacterium]